MCAGLSLARLLQVLEPGGPSVAAAPYGLDVAVSVPVLYDPLEAGVSRPGAVVLLVGVDPAAPSSAAVVAGLEGAAAAVVRSDPGPAVVHAAEGAGVALVVLTAPLPWARVYELAEGASGEREPAAGGAAAEALAAVPPGDLHALADDAAALLERPVVLLDTEWRLLAHSAVQGRWTDELQRELILNRAVPESEAPSATRRLLLAGNRALRFVNEEGGSPVWRVGVGIKSAGHPVGMLWVLEGPSALPEERLSVVEDVARLGGPHVARHVAARTRDRERRGRLAGLAIDGRDAAAACRSLGIDLAAGCAVAAVRPDGPAVPATPPGGSAPPGDGPAGLLDAVAASLAARRRGAACVQRDGTVYCLVPGPAPRRLLAEVAADLGGRRPIRAGVGPVARDARGLHRSRRLAELVLAVLEERGDRGVRAAGEEDPGLWARVAVRELGELLAARPGLLLHDLPALDGHEETALAWIEELGDAVRAAQRLGLHPNGVRYRVRRLAELGLDLGDPDTRLLAWLRLRLPVAAGQRPAEMQVAGPAAARVADEGD